MNHTTKAQRYNKRLNEIFDHAFGYKLNARKERFANKLENYDSKAMPEVLDYNKMYRRDHPDAYPYNDAIIKYICSQVIVPSELMDHLGTEVYLSQHDIRNEQKAIRDAKMLAEGFTPIAGIIAYRGPVELAAKKDMDFMNVSIATLGKIVNDSRGSAFFIPKGNRTRGYPLHTLSGYYKPLAI